MAVLRDVEHNRVVLLGAALVVPYVCWRVLSSVSDSRRRHELGKRAKCDPQPSTLFAESRHASTAAALMGDQIARVVPRNYAVHAQ